MGENSDADLQGNDHIPGNMPPNPSNTISSKVSTNDDVGASIADNIDST